MRPVLTILIVLISNLGHGQHNDSFNFLKKNHKLNRDYLKELNQDPSPVFVSTNPKKINRLYGEKEKLNIYPLVFEGDPRFVNPDLYEIRYDYKKFDMGDLVPNVLKQIGGNIKSID